MQACKEDLMFKWLACSLGNEYLVNIIEITVRHEHGHPRSQGLFPTPPKGPGNEDGARYN